MAEVARWQTQGGIEALRMTFLERAGGVRACFTGRGGGVSSRWNGGLNWSYSVGDDSDSVAENRRRTLLLLGLSPAQAVMAGLVHGDRVVAVTGDEPPGRDGVRAVPDCDALITDQPDVALVVTAADCVPVFLYDPVRRSVGIAHAGWRGTVGGIAGKTVQAMVRTYGCNPAEMLAVVGPSIGPCCYEVGDQVADPLRAQYGEAAESLLKPGSAPGKYLLDLWEANRFDLSRAGLTSAAVSGECSACGTDRYFSHRAEAGGAGRGAALIALTQP